MECRQNGGVASGDDANKTALVTGATSGVGYETAAQLAESGYTRVTITGRDAERTEDARSELVARTGRDVFDTLDLDLDQSESVREAVNELARRGNKIDFLLLNAGLLSGRELIRTDEGIERTFAPLVGHHLLTVWLLEDGMLSDHARIVVSGSEAARGDVPMMNAVDLPELAAKHYAGDLVAAAEGLNRFEGPVKYKPSTAYTTAKVFVAYWSAALARKLPAGMTVNAVSPGNTPGTGAPRNVGFLMRRVLLPIMKIVPGMSGTVSVAAGRYIEAAGYSDEVSGHFFASPPKKMIGQMEKVVRPHLLDRENQDATWDAIVRVAGGVDYPVAVGQESR